ncbi:MAG: transglycosylase SLT domain-containing protein [Sulfitobacter sp.]|uniref:transglycosylase SLT domain-containing protein n=2 Tax=Sulfitobacter sp. TaxID=1903071 RepID=UPI003B5FFDB3
MRVILAGLAVVTMVLIMPAAAVAEKQSWVEFYKSSPSRADVEVAQAIPNPAQVCISEILAAEQRYGIPDNLLLAIGIQEAGRQMNGRLVVWPWTANTNGKGTFFGSKLALEAYVRDMQAQGIRSTDVGCMQVNQRWHSDQFASLEAATTPADNVDYAARFLLQLYTETRDWWKAAGRYHSSNETYSSVYLRKLSQNQRIAQTQLAVLSSQNNGLIAAVQQVDAPKEPVRFGWSADLSNANSGKAGNGFSIYSSRSLEPILPIYAEVN